MSSNDSNRVSEENNKELDFVTSPTFQKAIQKAKWKQTIKFFIIGLLSTCILFFGIFSIGQYLLQNRLVNEDERLFSQINGSNVYMESEMIVYGFLNLSAVRHITFKKTIDDRDIVWNKQEVEVPFFGRENVIDDERFTESTEFSKRLNRQVHYNNFTGEREVEFFYPQLDYDILPNELDIATELDENTLAEVALSFDKTYKLKEIQKILREEDINWVWVNTTSKERFQNLKADPALQVLDGPSADGFQVDDNLIFAAETFLSNVKQLSKEGKYKSAAQEMAIGINSKSFPKIEDLQISGVVVSGTPSELGKLQDLEIVRASTIGATIDVY